MTGCGRYSGTTIILWPEQRSLIVGDGVIGSICEKKVNDDASVSPSEKDVNLNGVVDIRELSHSGYGEFQLGERGGNGKRIAGR